MDGCFDAHFGPLLWSGIRAVLARTVAFSRRESGRLCNPNMSGSDKPKRVRSWLIGNSCSVETSGHSSDGAWSSVNLPDPERRQSSRQVWGCQIRVLSTCCGEWSGKGWFGQRKGLAGHRFGRDAAPMKRTAVESDAENRARTFREAEFEFHHVLDLRARPHVSEGLIVAERLVDHCLLRFLADRRDRAVGRATCEALRVGQSGRTICEGRS